MTFLLQVASGQVTDPPPAGNSEGKEQSQAASEEKPKLIAFQKISQEILASQKQINQLYGSMPIGFPERQLEFLEKIKDLKAQVLALQPKVHRAAFEAYIESPNESAAVNRAIAIALERSLSPRLTTEKFDPKTAIEIASALIKNDVAGPPIYFAAFRASYALQDFERAKLMLDKIKSSKTEVNESFYTELAKTQENWNRELGFRQKEAAADDLPKAEIDTSAGKFTVELFEDHAPIAVANFISLAEQGYFDGNTFHLVQPGVLVRTGSQSADGQGNPGYYIPCECYQDEIRHHFTGSLSMSLEDGTEKDTGGSRFFITHQPNTTLDGKHTVFGRVVDNMEAIYQLNTVDGTRIVSEESLSPSVINKVTILRKRNHEYVPQKLPLKGDETPGS